MKVSLDVSDTKVQAGTRVYEEQRRCFCVPTTCEPKKFIFSITASRVLISLSHMSVPTSQPAVIESQNNIHTSHHLMKFGTYPKLTIKMTLQVTTNH